MSALPPAIHYNTFQPGCRETISPRHRKQKDARLDSSAYHMVLLARNLDGYKNLLKLTSIAALEGFYYKPRIDRELLDLAFLASFLSPCRNFYNTNCVYMNTQR